MDNLENDIIEEADGNADSEDSNTNYEYSYNEDEESDIIVTDYINSLPFIINRCLYPVDWFCDLEEFLSVSPLIYLCCAEVTRDANFLSSVFPYLPPNRYDLLMKTAICNDFRDSAAVLMSKWPSKTISVSVMDSDGLLCYSVCKMDFTSTSAKRLILLWRLFLDTIKNNATSQLRVLDLRGIPICDVMMNFIISRIIDLPTDGTRPKDYHIIIDCAIYSAHTLKKLTTYLTKANLPRNKHILHLYINSIDVTGLDETQCWTLLQQIDATDLVGLRVNSDFSDDFYTFIFSKFSSLKNLDISTPMLPAGKKLPFQLLSNLRRLQCATGFNNLSAVIPTFTLRELEYLSIGNRPNEDTIEDDFRYLISIPLALREVNLSGTLLMDEHLNLWRDLIRSLASTLTILEMERCLLGDDLFPSFVSFILPLVNLRYLSLADNGLSLEMFCKYMMKLRSMPKMKRLRVGFVNNTTDIHHQAAKEKLAKKFHKMVTANLPEEIISAMKTAKSLFW